MKSWQLALIRRELGASKITQGNEVHYLVTLVNQFRVPESHLEEPHALLAEMRNLVTKEIARRWSAVNRILEAQSRADYEEQKRKVTDDVA